MYRWSKRWLEAESALDESPRHKINAARSHLKRMEELRLYVEQGHAIDYYYREALALMAAVDQQASVSYRVNATDLRHLQGKWKVVRAERRGNVVDKPGDLIVLEVTGGIAMLRATIGDASGFITVDATAAPKTIDILGINEDFGVEYSGIYRSDENGLTICWRKGRDQRPKGFATKDEADDVVCLYLKRLTRTETK